MEESTRTDISNRPTTGVLLVGAGAAAGVDPRQWLPGACGLQMLPLGLSELER